MGHILPDEKINEVQLAKELKVSRGPIREAVRQLEKEALLVRKNNAVYVYKTSKEDLKHIYQVRTVLESLAVTLTTENLNENMVEQFRHIFSEKESILQDAGLEDISQAFSFECSKFHDLIFQGSRNPRLIEQANQLRNLTRFYMNTKLRIAERRNTIFQEHQAIFTAINNRDANKAYELMKDHMENDLAYLLEHF
jgi:DNA-binding GntR family transcriptional regulator